MSQSAAARRHIRHIVLVGVAAVGKTTLGQAAAPLAGVPFADTDLTMERWHGVTIDELSREPGGDADIDRLLWETYQALVGSRKRTVIAAPPRLLGRREFWRLTREHAASVHLRSTPLRVLRQDVAMRQAVPVAEVSLTGEDKTDFYDYYRWRLRHCRRADHELRLSGNLENDAERLGATVRALLGEGAKPTRRPSPSGA